MIVGNRLFPRKTVKKQMIPQFQVHIIPHLLSNKSFIRLRAQSVCELNSLYETISFLEDRIMKYNAKD